jgi:hypothetical protein
MKNFIPCNLDIDELLSTCPPNEVKKFSKDNLIYILHLLYSVPASNKDLETPDGLVPLYSKSLQKYIRNYNEYIKYLLRAKVIKTDNHYKPGQKCRGYRYTDKYNTIFKVVLVANSILKRHKKRECHFSVSMRAKYNHLLKWYTPALQIDRELAFAFIQADYERKLNNPSLRDYDEKNKKYKDPLRQFTSAYINIDRIFDADFKVNVDSNVNRLHSVLTNIRSEVRHCLTYKGQNLISIDIKNSQPYIAIILLSIGFWVKQLDNQTISIENIINNPYKKVYKVKSSYNSFIILVNDAIMQAGSDLQQFIDLVTNGVFYQYLSEVFEKELGKSFSSPKKVKETVFQVLFTDNRYFGKPDAAPKRKFKELFPSVYKIFALLKKKDKTLLPRLLQMIESHLILQVVTKRIARERPALPIITIHDSIVTTEGNENYVKQILEEELYKAIGHMPTLSVERWHPSLMRFNDNQLFIGEKALAA